VRERPVFIVVVSPDSMQSRSVDYEVRLAVTNDIRSPSGKLIVPVMYRECEMPVNLAMREWLSFLPPRRYEDALNDLLTVVKEAR
jgi:hypothetical protein